MRKTMVQEDIELVESRLKKFEEDTGCELLLVVADSADPYPAAPLRFGIISGFLISLIFSYYFEFQTALLWPVSFLFITIFMCWLGHFSWAKRLAMSSIEVERECKEKAIELFHSLGTSKVEHKVTAMIMVAMMEHEIEVLVDEKLSSKIGREELDDLVKIMLKHFSKGNIGIGLVQSIGVLEQKILRAFDGKVSDINPSELKDVIHFITD